MARGVRSSQVCLMRMLLAISLSKFCILKKKYEQVNQASKFHLPAEIRIGVRSDVVMSLRTILLSLACCTATLAARSGRHRQPRRQPSDQRASVCAGQRITFWSSDLHVAPPQDIANQFKHLATLPGFPKLTLVDKSLSGHCHLANTCAKDLRALTADSMVRGMTCGEKEAFWRAYASDAEMATVDAFLVSYALPTSLAFLPFDRPILLVVPVRYETGAASPTAWRDWTRALTALGRGHDRFVIAANSVFDRKYVQYFTGLPDDRVLYMPSYCSVAASYSPRPGADILIAPRRAVPTIVANVEAAFAKHGVGLTARSLTKAYDEYTMDQLAQQHVAIVFLPYTVSVMTFFELYRMNMPLLVPSKRLMIEWHLRHNLLSELTYPAPPGQPSPLPPAFGYEHWPDPNNSTDVRSLDFWLSYADVYTFSHLTYFDSVDDLVAKARALHVSNGWRGISEAMAAANARQLRSLTRMWRTQLLPRLFGASCHHRPTLAQRRQAYAQAALRAYPGVPHGC